MNARSMTAADVWPGESKVLYRISEYRPERKEQENCFLSYCLCGLFFVGDAAARFVRVRR